MKIETKQVYISDDGKTFPTEAECVAHEKVIADHRKNTTYWVVRANADTTEGRGHNTLYLIEAYTPGWIEPRVWMEDWCYRNLGRKVDFVMGVSPIESWILYESDAKRYMSDLGASIGSTSIPPRRISLTIGPKEEGLIPTL